MKRIDSINARPNANGVGKFGFSDNADLSGQDATYLTPDWLNHLQEELCNLIELNGISLNADSKQQLFNLLTTQSELVALSDAIESNFIRKAQKGAANGVTPLNAQSIIDSSFLPISSLLKAGIVQLVNDLITGGTDKALSAEQGKILQNNKLNITDFKSQLNASGEAPVSACRAWVNFNARPLTGTYVQSGATTVTVTMTGHGMSVGQLVNLSVSSGTGVSGSYVVTSVPSTDTFTYTAATILTTSGSITRNLFINASVNILGITDDGTGLHTITFIYDMPKTGYAVIGNATQGTAASAVYSADIVAMRTSAPGVLYNKTVSSFSIAVVDNNNDAVNDGNEIGIGVFA